MKAVEIPQFGAERLRVADYPAPEARPGWVRVAVRAVSLNYRDYLLVQGSYNPKLSLPFVPCSDMAGEVIGTGEPVMSCFMPGWQTGPYEEKYAKTALGGMWPGVLAEEVVLPETALVRMPGHLSYEEASTLPCAAVTAWNALVEQGRVQAGETVLLLGTGGVSMFGLQIAKMHGARVIVTSSSDDKLNRARALGADEVINYRTTPDWDKRAKELNGGRGVDHVLEVGGIGTFEKSLNAVRGGGRISYIGTLAGIQGQIKAAWIFHKHLTVQGIYVGSRSMLERVSRAMEQHRTKPVVDRVFSLDQIKEAFAHLASGTHMGKVVVRL